MNRILGGLLVAALLSNPSVLDDEFHHNFSLKTHAIYAAAKVLDDEREADAAQVSNLLYGIDDNSRNINNLLKDKFNLVAEIQTQLMLKSHTREPMSEAQISMYREWSECYSAHSDSINQSLKEIETKELNSATSEILKNNKGYESVYDKLLNIFDRQLGVINDLLSLIDVSRNTLAVL